MTNSLPPSAPGPADDPVTGDAMTRTQTEAERIVLDAVQKRAGADLRLLPTENKQLSARFLEQLIARCCETAAGSLLVQIRGAEINGSFHPPTGSRSEARRETLVFRECRFDAPVDVSGCDFLALRFVDCEMPAFIGASLVTRADLDLSGSRFAGVCNHTAELAEVGNAAVFLSNARIGGQLLLRSTPQSRFEAHGTVHIDGARIEGNVSCDGALFDGRGGDALNARSSTVGANVDLNSTPNHRFEAIGEVALVAARITGDLNCGGSRLHCPDGRALHCEDLSVESVFMGSPPSQPATFEASGRINFLSATVGGTFALANARLSPGPEMNALIAIAGPVALNLQQLRVSNALVLANIRALDADESAAKAVRGWFIFRGAELNVLVDSDGPCWPEHGFLDINGMTYQRILRTDSADVVETRSAWLRRQFPDGVPVAAHFRPQPYEELSRALRAGGQAREAGAIAVEKIRTRLAARVDRLPERIFTRILMALSHHGYSSSRATLSFLLFVIAGALMYSIALWTGQTFLPFEQDAVATVYRLPFGIAEVAVDRGCPGFDVVHFSLDFALPLINLGHDTYCRFAPEGNFAWLWSLLHSLFGLAGAALSAVVILTLTGVLRRD